jgi:hypothetical protein
MIEMKDEIIENKDRLIKKFSNNKDFIRKNVNCKINQKLNEVNEKLNCLTDYNKIEKNLKREEFKAFNFFVNLFNKNLG